MSRVPDYPTKPVTPIRTLQDYLDGGFVLRSFCSSGQGHSHVVDLLALVVERGPGVEVDYAFKRSLVCPECGAAGVGSKSASHSATQFRGAGGKDHSL